jgi:FtsP/CotA-like multicopper oxidase with cupredoxin domain
MPSDLSRRAVLAGIAATVCALPDRGLAAGETRQLEARQGSTALGKGPDTALLGFDGISPGPLLRYRQGEMLDVRLVNGLETPATIHWHGMRGDNAMDGVAPLTQQAVAPGADFDYRRALPEPGLFLYRPSVYGKTPLLMGRGLKGLMVVDEPAPLEADADLLVALDDWRLDPGGQFVDDFGSSTAPHVDSGAGRRLIVNGALAPAVHDARPGARVRLRLANLANSRLMMLSFDGVQPFVIAIDSQPCDAFEPVRRSIPVAPGARFELMFDMPETENARATVALRGPNGTDQDLVVLTARGAKVRKRDKIASLPQNPALPPEIKLAAARKVDLTIAAPANPPGSAWTINGVQTGGYTGAPLFRVKTGAPVSLGFINRSAVHLAMHVHGHSMRLLHDLDDGWEPYWRNGVIVPPGKTKHVAFLADAPGKWAIHDDILEHEAAGLATWFAVD